MPRIECDRVETLLLDQWQLLDSCLSEKAADLQKRSEMAQQNLSAFRSAQHAVWELGDLSPGQRHEVLKILERLARELQLDMLADTERAKQATACAELTLRNRGLVEKARTMVLIGLERGSPIPPDARFWREGAHNQLVIAWGDDALSCDAAQPRLVG